VPWQQQKKNPAHPVFSREDRAVNASSDLTLALRRMDNMMTEELSKSQFAHDTLQESTAALAQLGETYSVLDTMLSSSKNLLGTLLRSQKSDTWYLETAFYILVTTIGWLVFRRLLYGPLSLVMWLPMLVLRLFGGAWYRVFAAAGLLGGSNVDIGGSSVIDGLTMMHSSSATATIIGSDAPTISVGQSLSARETDAPRDESMSEQVEQIIDESHNNQASRDNNGEIAEDERLAKQESTNSEPVEAAGNPKKRMWEEEKESVLEEQRKKDEL
jgi:protein transport protein SEC20